MDRRSARCCIEQEVEAQVEQASIKRSWPRPMGRGVPESTTHLPLSVTTFNTIEAVASLTLCASEQKLLPVPDRSKIRALGNALERRSG